MRLFIPELGTRLRLIQPWSFNLYCESRNDSLLWHYEYFKRNEQGRKLDTNFKYNDIVDKLKLDIGCILKVDRIYIRKGANKYSSVTFHLTLPDGRKSTKPLQQWHADLKPRRIPLRFWAKLNEVNTIECEIVE